MPNFTEWKFLDFPITQILREINLRDSQTAKSAIFTISEALNFDFQESMHFLKAETYHVHQNQTPITGKNGRFRSSRFSKIDFT